MKKQLLYTPAFLLLVISLASCTMDKRLYRKGYNIEWSASKKAELPSPEGIAAAVSPLPEVPAMKDAEAGLSTDSLLQLSSDEDRAIADKAESQTECNDYAMQERAKALTDNARADQPEAAGTAGKKARNRIDFNNGFKRGFQFVDIRDELLDEPRLMPLALAALICGIVSIVAYYGAFVLGVLAIVFGAVAMYKIRQNPGVYRGRRMALAGFILGIISLAIISTIVIFY